MMKNIISSPYRKMKILLILPVFAIVLYAFAKPDYKYKYVEESSGNIVSGTSLQQNSVKGTVVQQDGKPLAAVNIIITGTTTGTITDINGKFRIENIPKNESLVISYVGFKPKVVKPDFTSEMSITMVRDTVRYNNLEIGTPPPPPPPPPMNAAGDINVPPPPPPPPATGIDIKGDGPQPLYVVDGTIASKAEVKKINPETIESIYVLKDKSATEKPATDKYGEKGKDGVIEIHLKKTPEESDGDKEIAPLPPFTPSDAKFISRNGKTPLVIIDGTIKDIDLNKIDPATIESISVLGDYSAVNKYGDKGKDGVILVTTKKKVAERDTLKQKTNENPFVVVEEMPEFKGGSDAMASWIISNLKYPAEALKNKTTGKVLVNFTVTWAGKIKNVAVSKSVSPLLDAEAIRVISSMPDWKPGVQGGKPVDVQYCVPVEFKLN